MIQMNKTVEFVSLLDSPISTSLWLLFESKLMSLEEERYRLAWGN